MNSWLCDVEEENLFLDGKYDIFDFHLFLAILDKKVQN